jgi:hypothetical protein
LTSPRSPAFFHSAYLAAADLKLLTATFSALEEAELQDVLEQIKARLFAESLCCEIIDEAGVFRPFIELLLREILALAATEWSAPTKRRQMHEAITLAGF